MKISFAATLLRYLLMSAPGILITLSISVELVLIAADNAWIGTPIWRPLAYQNGAFWAGLLHNWRPNYTLQPELMFVSYAFLHAGFGHLLGNMLTLAYLGQNAVMRVGQGGFLFIYTLSAVGGGLAFGLISNNPQPMVGASGALSGLVGAWLYWDWRDRGEMGLGRWPIWRTVTLLIALNIVIWIALDGLLAWETHLGGALAGCVGAMLMPTKGNQPSGS